MSLLCCHFGHLLLHLVVNLGHQYLFQRITLGILIGFDYSGKTLAAVIEEFLSAQLEGIVPQVFEYLFRKALCIVQIVVRGEIYAKAFIPPTLHNLD